MKEIKIQIPATDYHKLEDIARKRGLSVDELVASTVRIYMHNHKRGNTNAPVTPRAAKNSC